jgi:hypothetical protein
MTPGLAWTSTSPSDFMLCSSTVSFTSASHCVLSSTLHYSPQQHFSEVPEAESVGGGDDACVPTWLVVCAQPGHRCAGNMLTMINKLNPHRWHHRLTSSPRAYAARVRRCDRRASGPPPRVHLGRLHTPPHPLNHLPTREHENLRGLSSSRHAHSRAPRRPCRTVV